MQILGANAIVNLRHLILVLGLVNDTQFQYATDESFALDAIV